jgi:hypothetical protein
MNEVLVQVVGAAQRLSFETGELENFASIRFLNRVHELPITLEEFELLFNSRMGKAAAQDREEDLHPSGVPRKALFEKAEESATPVPVEDVSAVVNWASLPDAILGSQLKRALTVLGVPNEVLAPELRELVKGIQEEFTEEDWTEVNQAYVRQAGVPPPSPAPPPAPVQPAPPRPPVGQVTWSDGAPVLPQSRPARTVPKDDMGYPIVRGAGVDPDAVIGGGDDYDEDGIGQA